MSRKQTAVINGVQYFSAAYAAGQAGVSRTTLWRWRQSGKVPEGRRRQRDRQILYTEDEVQAVVDFAQKLEPGDEIASNQISLFSDNPGDGR